MSVFAANTWRTMISTNGSLSMLFTVKILAAAPTAAHWVEVLHQGEWRLAKQRQLRDGNYDQINWGIAW